MTNKGLTPVSNGNSTIQNRFPTGFHRFPPKETLVIMDFLDQGLSGEEIAGELKISKSAVSKKIKKLKKFGFVKETCYSSKKFYEVTPRGKTRMELNRISNISQGARAAQLTGGSVSTGDAPVDIHHIQIKFPILKDGKDPNWKEWNMKNWSPKYKKVPILGASFVKTTKHIKVNIYAKKCNNPNEIYRIVTIYSMLASSYLKDSFEMEIDLTRLALTAIDYHMPDPGSEELVKKGLKPKLSLQRDREKIGPLDPDQQAKVWADESPFAGRETNDLVHAQRYLAMPETVHTMATELIPAIKELKEASVDLQNNWRSHQRMILSNTETNEVTRDLIIALTKTLTKKMKRKPMQMGLGGFL